MEAKGWFVKRLSGGTYQQGMPDLVAFHPVYKHRWIELKSSTGSLTASQRIVFTQMQKCGEKIFILRDEKDYKLLFEERDNWWKYLI